MIHLYYVDVKEMINETNLILVLYTYNKIIVLYTFLYIINKNLNTVV